jgi:hypothetical protein
MKNSFFFIAMFLTLHTTVLLGQSGFEQYYYLQKNTTPLMVPVIHNQGKHNWYTEVRYNYEEENSLGIYAGKSFSRTIDLWEYSVTPIMGGILGQFNGGSVGLNTTVDYKDFFFSSQTQFTFSSNDSHPDFFYGWFDVGYAPLQWLSFGCSLQHSMYGQPNSNFTEAGLMVGFTVGKWTFPVYSFNPLDTNPYFVLGITHMLGLTNDKR